MNTYFFKVRLQNGEQNGTVPPVEARTYRDALDIVYGAPSVVSTWVGRIVTPDGIEHMVPNRPDQYDRE